MFRTYYAEAPVEGYDPSGPNDSQGYITELAARALIFIQSDNEKIGLMCFVAVGMAEVSSCEIMVTEGQQVKKEILSVPSILEAPLIA